MNYNLFSVFAADGNSFGVMGCKRTQIKKKHSTAVVLKMFLYCNLLTAKLFFTYNNCCKNIVKQVNIFKLKILVFDLVGECKAVVNWPLFPKQFEFRTNLFWFPKLNMLTTILKTSAKFKQAYSALFPRSSLSFHYSFLF